MNNITAPVSVKSTRKSCLLKTRVSWKNMWVKKTNAIWTNMNKVKTKTNSCLWLKYHHRQLLLFSARSAHSNYLMLDYETQQADQFLVGIDSNTFNVLFRILHFFQFEYFGLCPSGQAQYQGAPQTRIKLSSCRLALLQNCHILMKIRFHFNRNRCWCFLKL